MAYTRLDLENGIVLDAAHIEHIEDGIVELETEQTKAKNSVVLVDHSTGSKYVLYVDNGKLTMALTEG